MLAPPLVGVLQWSRARESAEIAVFAEAAHPRTSRLQWSRARESAEISGQITGGLTICLLQWSRARESAEIAGWTHDDVLPF